MVGTARMLLPASVLGIDDEMWYGKLTRVFEKGTWHDFWHVTTRMYI